MDSKAIGRNIMNRLDGEQKDCLWLAEEIGVRPETINNYITGKRQPTAYALLRISRKLDCTMETLMCGVENTP